MGVLDDTIATCCVPHNACPGFRVTPKTPTDPSLARLAAKFTTFLGREHLFRRPLVPNRPANGTPENWAEGMRLSSVGLRTNPTDNPDHPDHLEHPNH